MTYGLTIAILQRALLPGVAGLAAALALRRRRAALHDVKVLSVAGVAALGTAMVLCWLAARTILLLVLSLRWPMVLDAPLMNYVALRIRHGAVPYRDVIDMNLPGTYAIHLLAVAVGANTDLGWRAFDLAFLTVTCGAIWAYCRKASETAAWAGALFFAAYHLSCGPINAGQRDYFLFGFLMAAAAMAVGPAERDGARAGRWWAAAAGMCLGFGVWIKPTALLFGAALWWLAWRDRGDRGDRRRGLRTAFALGALAVSAGMTLWLAASGGLGPFVALMREFVGPVYQNLSERPFAESLRMRAHVLVPCCLCLVAGALARRKDARDRVLLAGCVYGLAHILLQRKLFFYHLYPLAGFSCALAATWLRGSLLEVCTPRALARTAAVAAFAAWLGFWPARLNPSTYQASIVSSVYDGMTADLRARVTPRSRVQVLDTASGGLAALMRLDMRNATPYIYDFPFFQGGRAPVLLRMRADFLRRMEASPPDVIVFARYGWPRGQYERIAAFPELAAWMRAHYRLDVERVHYRIYVKRA